MAVDVRWLTVFLDRPAATYEPTVDHWRRITATTPSTRRGGSGEFLTLLPADGDAYVRMQRVDTGGGVHVDLHVDDIARAVAVATSLGAEAVHEHAGVPVLRSPAGMTFCVVTHRGESARPAVPQFGGARSQLDRACIDIPAAAYDGELAFWRSLTGWTSHPTHLDEFTYLVSGPGLALQLLFQRLGDDSSATAANAHVDLACGDDVDALVPLHVALGATVVAEHQWWTTLADPAGFPYCLIRRTPFG